MQRFKQRGQLVGLCLLIALGCIFFVPFVDLVYTAFDYLGYNDLAVTAETFICGILYSILTAFLINYTINKILDEW